MINYLQLGRNMQRFAPRVEAKAATYIFNAKGIYDFKQMSPEIKEELTNSFRGIEYPILEISIKKSNKSSGLIRIIDGRKEVSSNNFVLKEDENIEDYMPVKSNGCTKKLIYDKTGIEKIGEQYNLLKKFLTELTCDLKQPILELWIKDKSKYTIGNMVILDGDKEITRGYFSRTKNVAVSIDKFHFINKDELISGYGKCKDIFTHKFKRLPEKLLKRLWMLDERTKKMMKMRYGVECSPKTPDQIAARLKLSGARVRDILNTSREEMENADTYISELKSDLDNLGEILSEQERYKIYRDGSSLDINEAKYKIIKHNRDKQKRV